MATGTPVTTVTTKDVPFLVAIAARLDGLTPLLHFVTRFRWALCAVGALQGLAPIQNGGIQPVDLVRFAEAGKLILQGRFSEVYADPWMQAGPFELLASWLLFPFDHQHQAQYVKDGLDEQFWLRLSLGAAVVAAAMLLIRYLRRAHGLSPSGPMELAAGLTTVLLAVPYLFLMGGHLAQFGAPLMWVAGASLLIRGRTVPAGLVIGLSAGWEPWGVLAAGLLMAERSPVRLVRGCAAFAFGAVVTYLPFVLTGHFEMFGLDWAILPHTLISAYFPGLTEFSWQLRLLQGIASGLAGVALALALGRRRDLLWLGPLAVLVVRLLLDPLILSYYWYPFLLAVVIGVGLMHPRFSPLRTALTLGLAAVPFLRFRYLQDQDVLLLGVAAILLSVLVLVLRREERHPVPDDLEPGQHGPDPAVGAERLGHG